MIYKKHFKNVPMTPAAFGGTGSSVKRSENWSHPIPSISLGRQTTTYCDMDKEIIMEGPELLIKVIVT